MKGYVYVLSNQSMPGMVKVGRSVNGGRERAKALSTTGVPTPFVVEFEILVDDCCALEYDVHAYLEDRRVSDKREFFKCCADDAARAILECHVAHGGEYLIGDVEFEAVASVSRFAQALDESTHHIAPAYRFLEVAAVREAVSKYKAWMERRLKEVRNA